MRADPQPGLIDPVWQDNYPNGAVYICSPLSAPPRTVWLLEPPAGAAGGITPEEVARRAVDTLSFKAGEIGIVPEPRPGKVGVVGLPTWMWISNPGPSTTGPLTATASAGGITVTATATLDRIEWDMGDGTTVTCAGSRAKGTAYAPHYRDQDSPTCGHRYRKTSGNQPGGAFTVTARSYWVVNWSGGGQSGTITMDPLTNTANVRVGEMQVLTQRG